MVVKRNLIFAFMEGRQTKRFFLTSISSPIPKGTGVREGFFTNIGDPSVEQKWDFCDGHVLINDINVITSSMNIMFMSSMNIKQCSGYTFTFSSIRRRKYTSLSFIIQSKPFLFPFKSFYYEVCVVSKKYMVHM